MNVHDRPGAGDVTARRAPPPARPPSPARARAPAPAHHNGARAGKAAFILLLLAAATGLMGYWYVIPAPVTFYAVQPRLMSLEINGPGLLDAINRVVITSRIQGFLKEVKVDRNDRVTTGQVLALLDSEDLRNQVAAAQADAVAAHRTVAEIESERDRAVALFDKTKVELGRRTTLLRLNATSQAEVTTAEAAFKQAEADVARANASIERSKAQALSKEASVKVLEARLADATITSPLDGVVISRERNPGELLLPGVSLMQLVDEATIIVSARFDESARSAIRPGQAAKIRFASDPSRTWNGRVLRLSRQVDQETREFTVDITLDALPDSWAMGQRVNVAVEARSPAMVIGVPETLIARRDGRAGIWVGQNGRAVWTPVALGYASGSDIQVAHGLSAGDIVLPPEGRYDYQPVVDANAPAPPPQSRPAPAARHARPGP